MSKSKRIAFLFSSLKFGGAERVALNLAKAIKVQGYEVDFLLMSFEGEFLAEAKNEFNVIDLSCERTWKLPFKLVEYLLKRKPLGFISSFWKLNLCACVAKAFQPSLKLLLWEHSPPSKSLNSPTWLYGISASIFYPISTAIVCVSSGVHADIASITIGLKNKARVIFNPIPSPDVGIADFHKSEGSTHHILWVGRMDFPKNPNLMLKAFALLPAKDGWKLDLVGDGPLRKNLEQYAETLGVHSRVNFLGFLQNPYLLMRGADLLVLTSDREGLPTVLIEALYCGLSVVSTDCGQGIHDILLDSRYGSIVPIGDAVALAQAIKLQYDRPTNRNDQIKSAQRFLPQVISKQFLRALGII